MGPFRVKQRVAEWAIRIVIDLGRRFHPGLSVAFDPLPLGGKSSLDASNLHGLHGDDNGGPAARLEIGRCHPSGFKEFRLTGSRAPTPLW